MGESTQLWSYHIDNDLAFFPYTSSINIACGYHAGDEHTMHELVHAALTAGIAVGAHPGFADRNNFGRNDMQLSPVKIYDLLIYQLGALDAFLKINGTRLHHVKPHGALYNMAAKDPLVAGAICKAVKEYNDTLIIYGLSNSQLLQTATIMQLTSCSEVFADRRYQDDGRLTLRNQPDALITDEAVSIQQVLQMLQKGTVTTLSGNEVPVNAGTLCIHSDGAHALSFARRIHEALKGQHISIRAV